MHYVKEEAYLRAQGELRDFEREYHHISMLVSNWARYGRDRNDDLWAKVLAYLDMIEGDLRIMQGELHPSKRRTGAISDLKGLLETVGECRSSISIVKSYLDNLPRKRRSDDTVTTAFHLTIMGADLDRIKAWLRYPYVAGIGGNISIRNVELAARCSDLAGAVEALRSYISSAELGPEEPVEALAAELEDVGDHVDLVLFAAGKVGK